jgi:hypothetical protein
VRRDSDFFGEDDKMKETFCCTDMEQAVACGFIGQMMVNGERSVVCWESDGNPRDIDFCPFCGTDLRENKEK